MKAFYFLLLLPVLLSCNNGPLNNKSASYTDTIRIHDTLFIPRNEYNWQEGFGLSHEPDMDSVWNKPVRYYIEDENCSGLAFDFYYGFLKPSDNGTTTELLKLAVTNNKKLRPFYRWCLNKTLVISDGALGELTGIPAREYAEKYPDEFFEYLDSTEDGTKYKMWTEAIAYSGNYDYHAGNEVNRKRLENIMISNLKTKTQKNTERIRKFAKDCTTL